MNKKDQVEWEVFFTDIIKIHPPPTIIMLKIDEHNKIHLIAAASTLAGITTALKQTKVDIYSEYIG